MKFKISTLIWLTTLIAIFVAGWAMIQSERKAHLEAREALMVREQMLVEQKAQFQSQLQDFEFRLSHVEAKSQPFQDLNPDSKPHLMWLDRLSWSGSSVDRERSDWDWRLFLPKDHAQIQFCWAVGQIPEEGLPDDSVVTRRDVSVSQKSTNLDGTVETKTWLGCAVLHCELLPFAESNYRLSLSSSPHRLDAMPFSTATHDGLGLFSQAEDTEWLKANILGDRDAIESSEVNENEQREVSFNEPHVLVRIRGKKKIDGKFESVDGPAPGFMLWLEKKQ